MLAGVTAMMLVLAGMEWKYLLVACWRSAAGPGGAAICWFRGGCSAMLVFLNPESDPQGAGFHINQSLIAVGTGGLTGRGYMEGMQKLFYLPEASTDFIFANIAEELGFIGAILHCAAVCRLRLCAACAPRSARRIPLRAWWPSASPPHSAAGFLQHQRGAVAGAHQRNSAAADLVGRDLGVCARWPASGFC